ncbi:MAG: hypothetical protein WC455_29810 [Dehalococcoidia bacterium]
MAITQLAQVQDTINTIHEEAEFTAQHKAVMRGLVWNIKASKGQTTTNVPYFGEAVSHPLTEGNDMVSSETMEDTNVPITPGEHGLKIVLTDSAIEDDNEDLKRAAGTVLGDAYEKERDELLLGQLDDATNSLAGAGTTLTMGHIAAARALLAGNPTSAGGPAPTPYVAVIHPFQELDIVDVLTPVVPAAGTTNVTGTAFTDEVLKNYSIARLFGMPIISDGNLPIDSGADAKAGVFAAGKRGAIIYVEKRRAEIEPERDASLRGWELNYVGRYGYGEYMPGWIVELHTDASTPA